MPLLGVPVQRTTSVGDIWTAAMFNSNVRDAVNFLANPPVARITQATNQSLGNSTPTAIAFDAAVSDTYSGHSTTVNNGNYAAQVAGYYEVDATVSFGASAAGVRSVGIYYNGASQPDTVTQVAASSTVSTALSTGKLTQFMNVGDVVAVVANQTSGGTLLTNATGCGMRVKWIHA